MSERYLVVGLGNPGREFENTRHNIGFRCTEALVRAHNIPWEPKKKSKATIADGIIAGKRTMIAKPQTYMNLSGSAVQGLAAFYQIPPEHILVIFDDLDLPPGTLRIRSKGGSSGHKGMTDIIQRLGTQDFPRIRFGIGRPPGRMDPAAYVLQRFGNAEEPAIEETVQRAVSAVELWLSAGIDQTMNLYNGTSDDVATRLQQAEETPPLPHQPE